MQFAIDLIKSPDPQVQNTAIHSLWMFSFQPACREKLKEPQTIQALRDVEQTGDKTVKESVRGLLFQLGERKRPERSMNKFFAVMILIILL